MFRFSSVFFVFAILFIGMLAACESADKVIADGDSDLDLAEAEIPTDGDILDAEIDLDIAENDNIDADYEAEFEVENETELELEIEIEQRLYSVYKGAIQTKDGHYLYLRGVNISNLAKGASDFLYNLTAEDIRILKESGINSVRLLTFWNAIAPNDDGTFDTTYLDAYLARVKMLTDAGFYVILDMHQDLWGVPFLHHGAPDWACPEDIKEGFVWQSPWWKNYISSEVSGCFDNFFEHPDLQDKFAAAWKELASLACDDPMVLGFDIINEPLAFGGLGNRAFDNEILSPFYQRVMNVIEDACPGRLYFWEHGAGFILRLSDPFIVPENLRDRVIVSPHFYPTSVHEPSEEGYILSLEDLESDLMALLQTYIDAETPIWMGEYGGLTNAKGFDEYMQQIHTIFYKYGISSAQYGYERNDGGFAFIDSNSELKDVFKPVFLIPLATELPTKPDSMIADWDAGSMTSKFNCITNKRIKVTMPSVDATCQFDPPGIVAEFIPSLGQTLTTCQTDGAVTMTCTRAAIVDGDVELELDLESD